MITLTVYREWESAYNQTTILKDSKGAIKKIISSSIQQLKRGEKEIRIKETVYKLDWSNVPAKYIPVKERT